MRRLAWILPWLIVILLAGTIVFLLTRVVRPWETRSVNAAPVVMAIRKIAQFSTVAVDALGSRAARRRRAPGRDRGQGAGPCPRAHHLRRRRLRLEGGGCLRLGKEDR